MLVKAPPVHSILSPAGQRAMDDQVPDLPLDSRLTEGTLSGAVARIIPQSSIAVSATIRVLTSHDLVLVLPPECHLNTGEVVLFSLYEGDKIAARNERGIVHFAQQIGNIRIAGIYSVRNLDKVFLHRYFPDRRTEIRFPIHHPAVVSCRHDNHEACILNYSVNGVGLFSKRAMPLKVPCQMTIESETAKANFSVTAHWRKKTKQGFTFGCSLNAKHGVVLACRKIHGPSSRQLLRLEQMADAATGEQLKAAHVVVERAERHLTHLRAVTPFLSAFAVGVSLQAEGHMQHLTLSGGLIGGIASLVFTVLPKTKHDPTHGLERFAGTLHRSKTSE